jgi:hypothetical protein
MSVLFILKRREDFNAVMHSHVGLSTGLYNSAKFIDDMLQANGVTSNLEVAIDNNCIDRLVKKHNPEFVIIEALWVVPTKFAILQKLHPKVKWIIRLHSEMPFMAGEGMAMDWVGDYSAFKNVIIACNAPRMKREIDFFLKHKHNCSEETAKSRVIYLPNFYPQNYIHKPFNRDKEHIDIACFGAIRPLKNHLVQAFAAVEFANQIGKKLRFHVNAGRIEMNGSPVINNLKGFFQQIYKTGDQLVNHQWRPREEFLKLCAEMDMGLQCNFSETFNIVGADLISQGIPLISNSKEIPWAIEEYCASPVDGESIIRALHKSYEEPELNAFQHQHSLNLYTTETSKIWTKYFLRG